MQTTVTLPKKPVLVKQEGNKAVFEIDNLYPGYGVTVGNALRRVILSSIPGAAITAVKIKGVSHEFSTIEGVLEDVIEIMLNIKQIRVKLTGDDPQKITLVAKGGGKVTAADIETPSQVEIINKDQHIATLTDKKTVLEIEMDVERGVGYVTSEVRHKEKLSVGTIALDAIFTPIRRVNFESENMRVGDRTDFNKVILTIETDGSISAEEAMNIGITILIEQFSELGGVGVRHNEEETLTSKKKENKEEEEQEEGEPKGKPLDVLEQSVREIGASTRVTNILLDSKLKTIGKLLKKKEADILALEGMGEAGVKEIKSKLAKMDLTLKD